MSEAANATGEGMRYTLTGELQSSYSHDHSRFTRFEEYFDADDLNTAVLISKAMLQSRKIRSEKGSNLVENLSGVLKDGHHNGLWSSNLVRAQTHTEIKVVVPEHFKEEFAPPVDDDDFSRSEQSA